MIHQEQQNSSLTSRLTTLQEDVGKSPARKRSLTLLCKVHCVPAAVSEASSVNRPCLCPLRSASVTNMSLDRSGSSMVPSYDSSVSPPTSRAMSGTKSGTKLDHSEEERKILLVIA